MKTATPKTKVSIELGTKTDGYRFVAEICGVVRTSKVYATVEKVEKALDFVFGRGRWERECHRRITRLARF